MEIWIMNWKRGFKRIFLGLAIFVAIVCAGLSIAIVFDIYSNAQGNLRWEEKQLAEEGEITRALSQIKEELLKIQTSPGKLTPEEQQKLAYLRAKGKYVRFGTTETQEQILAGLNSREVLEARLEELQKGFWVSLSKGGLVGLCGAVGLVGGIIGFVIVWLIYKFFEGLVLGFCDNNHLPPEKT